MISRPLRILFLAGALGALAGCSATKEWQPEPKKKIFMPVYRQHAAEPVYSRLRWVHLPEPLPVANVRAPAGAPALFPVVHLELKNNTLEEAAAVLAATSRYRSYCASGIAARKITFDSLGTIDELASALADNQKIDIVIDHDNREVRFLAREVAPTFYNEQPVEGKIEDKKVSPAVIEEKVLSYEHKSNN